MSPLYVAIVAAQLALGPPSPSSDERVPELALRWDAPEPCPDVATVRGYVADYIEEGVPLRRLEAQATVVRSGQRWALRLRFDGQLRELEAASCDDLAQAASVILSLALVPGGLTAEVDDESPAGAAPADVESSPGAEAPAEAESQSEAKSPAEAGSQPDAESPTETEAPVEAESQPNAGTPASTPDSAMPRAGPRETPRLASRPAPRVQGIVRPEAAIGTGISPTLTTGRLAVGVRWSSARVELAGTLWTPADAPDSGADGRRALVTMGSVQAHGCGVLRSGALEFPLCAGFGLGAVRVDDPGTSPRTTTHRLWAGVMASGALIWRFRPQLGLWVGPELTVALRRVFFPLEPSPLNYRTGPVAVRGAIGVEFNFPSRAGPRAGKRSR